MCPAVYQRCDIPHSPCVVLYIVPVLSWMLIMMLMGTCTAGSCPNRGFSQGLALSPSHPPTPPLPNSPIHILARSLTHCVLPELGLQAGVLQSLATSQKNGYDDDVFGDIFPPIFVDHISRISWHYAIPHAPCGVLHISGADRRLQSDAAPI